MIVSRIVPMATRSLEAFKKVGTIQTRRLISTSGARSGGGGGYTYREIRHADKKWEIWAEVAGAGMWWWIFWHCMTDYHHIIGHYAFPNIAEWTDEELGIPPDDADDPE